MDETSESTRVSNNASEPDYHGIHYLRAIVITMQHDQVGPSRDLDLRPDLPMPSLYISTRLYERKMIVSELCCQLS